MEFSHLTCSHWRDAILFSHWTPRWLYVNDDDDGHSVFSDQCLCVCVFFSTQVEHSGHEQVARHRTLAAESSSTTVTDLEPGVTYKFIIEAVTSVKTSLDLADGDDARRTTTVLSKPIIARTRAPCEAPQPIVSGYTPTTVRLHWRRPLLEAVTDRQRHVRLALERYRLDINGQPHMRLSPATQECTLIKCRPGKTYSISLVAITCTENSKKTRSKKVYFTFCVLLLQKCIF